MDQVKLFARAQKLVDFLPESCGRGMFNLVGTVAGALPTKRTKQLLKNQARLRPGMGKAEAFWLANAAMRSYMRYYYEAFRLPSLTKEQILARVSATGLESIRAELAAGRAVTGALTHSGNWDFAGAWAHYELAPVHTLAEKLEPEELYQFFVGFREALGMTIYPAARGSGSLAKLQEAMAKAPVFTPVLADRDLAASGLEVTLAGLPAMVAPGPALLAQRTGATLFPVFISYEKLSGSRRKKAGSRWGIHLDILPGITPTTNPSSPHAERVKDVHRITQEWVSAIEPYLRAHVVDWHMLQKVFVADLDPERLARTRERAAQAAAKEHEADKVARALAHREEAAATDAPQPSNDSTPTPETRTGSDHSGDPLTGPPHVREGGM
ncbi:phosphatidylinositol mannoside acyltransferase [Arcanobacterium haemolyticum]|nr:phosphatidylinositol mannoside acyltransferase [Arcanobacterium haemolyticum]